MSYGVAIEVACPGGCGVTFTRVDYDQDPPPIPTVPAPRWFIDERGCSECPRCEVDLEETYQEAIAA